MPLRHDATSEELVKVQCFGEANGREIICRISHHNYLNQIEGILYTNEYDFNEQFKNNLMEDYSSIDDVTDVYTVPGSRETNKTQHSY